MFTINRKTFFILFLFTMMSMGTYVTLHWQSQPGTKYQVGSLVSGLPVTTKQHEITPLLEAINGQFLVSIWQNGSWKKIGVLSYSEFFRTKQLNLSSFSAHSTFQLRIEQQGGGAGHIDSILINDQAPISAKGISLKKISKTEFDVVDAWRKPIEVTFTVPQNTKDLTLEINGRVEPKEISKTPFLYPTINTHSPISAKMSFYEYKLGSNPGTLSINGELTGENLGKPFFSEHYYVGTGHPQGKTYGWIRDDGRFLYVAMDFTPDNTYDDDADYSKVIVKVGNRIKEFKVSVPEHQWGKQGFTYTDKVVYQHKVYEFKIPFGEIGLTTGYNVKSSVQLAFAAYGTAAAGIALNDPAMVFNSTENEYMSAYGLNTEPETILVQRYDASGSKIGSATTISNTSIESRDPSIAFDSENNRYLVVYEERISGRFYVKGQLVTANGAGEGSQITVCSDTSNHYNNDVAFDSVNARYLVVWESGSGYPDPTIHGQLLTAAGNLYDPDTSDGTDLTNPAVTFQISPAGQVGNTKPVVAFDPTSERFLVSYLRSGKVYGVILSSTDGSEVVSEFEISGSGSSVELTSTANTRTGGFLTVFRNNRNDSYYDLYGQMIQSNGTLVDHDGNGTPDAANDNFVISATANTEEHYPAVDYNPTSQQFFVVWRVNSGGNLTDDDIYYQLIAEDGTLSGSQTALGIHSPTAILIYYTDNPVVSNSVCNNTMVMYTNQNTSPYTQITSVIGTCAPIPIVSSYSPASAAEGDTVVITGKYFTDVSAVKFGSIAAASYTVDSDTQISAIVATGESGSISVTNANGTVTKSGFTFTISNNAPTAPVLSNPANGATVTLPLTLTWKKSSDPDGDAVTYSYLVCEDQDFSGCDATNVTSSSTSNDTEFTLNLPGFQGDLIAAPQVPGEKQVNSSDANTIAFWTLFLLLSLSVTGMFPHRKKMKFVVAALLAAGLLTVGCKESDSDSDSADTESVVVRNLESGKTYYWKVIAKDENNGETSSDTWSFTVNN